MATTAIWPVRDNLARVVEYAENHLKTANPGAYTAAELKDLHDVLQYAANDDKTARQFYVTGVNCIGEIAYRQMSVTKQRFGKTGGNLAYHAYQSFAPDEVTPEQCHKIGIELAKQLWGDRYEVLVSTHLNTHCVHNHMVINSVSFVDGKKLDNNYAMYFDTMRAGSDRICCEYGLSVIENPGESKGNYWLQKADERGEPTMWNIIRSDIDEAIRQSMTERQFYQKMKQWGYSFDFNPNRKYPTLRAQGMKQNLRFKTLGENYLPERIVARILENRPVYVPPVQIQIMQYRFRGTFHKQPRLSGIYIMYLLFTLILRRILGRVESHPQKINYTPELRNAVRQLKKYSEETQLLCRHKIQTVEQLTAFIETRKQNLSDLEHRRGKVYNRMKSAKTPEKLSELRAERDKLSCDIKVIRRELFYLHDVLERSDEVRAKLRRQREFESKQLDLNKSNPKQTERKILR